MMFGWNRVTACVRCARSTVSEWQRTARYVGGDARRLCSATTSDGHSVRADDAEGKSKNHEEEDALATGKDPTLHGLIASSGDLAEVLRKCRPLGDKLRTCTTLRTEHAFFLMFEDPQSAAEAKIVLAEHFQISDVANDDLRPTAPSVEEDTSFKKKTFTNAVHLKVDDLFSAVDSDSEFCGRIDYISFAESWKYVGVFFTDTKSAVEAICGLKPSVCTSPPKFFGTPFTHEARKARQSSLVARYEVPYPTPRLLIKSLVISDILTWLNPWRHHILMHYPLWDEGLYYLLFTDSAAAFLASRNLTREHCFVAEAPAEQALREEESLVMFEKTLLSEEGSSYLDAHDGDQKVSTPNTDEKAVNGPLLVVSGAAFSEHEARNLAIAIGLSKDDVLLIHIGQTERAFIWMRSMESGRHLGSSLTQRGYLVEYHEGFAREKKSTYKEVLARFPVDREVFPRRDVSLQHLIAWGALVKS